MNNDGKLQGRPALTLAFGVVTLEFASSVAVLVVGTLLPVIEQDLSAQSVVPLLVSSATLGMFTALPLSGRLIQRFAPSLVLTFGLATTIGGSILAAVAPDPVGLPHR